LALDHPVAAEHFLGFGEGAVGDHGLAAGEGNPHAHGRRVQPVERDQHAGILQRLVVFHHRGHRIDGRHGTGRRRLVALRNHQHHESHRHAPFDFNLLGRL